MPCLRIQRICHVKLDLPSVADAAQGGLQVSKRGMKLRQVEMKTQYLGHLYGRSTLRLSTGHRQGGGDAVG